MVDWKHGQGIRSTKMVADQSAPKIPKMPENLSTQIILNLKFQLKKGLPSLAWASVVRGFVIFFWILW